MILKMLLVYSLILLLAIGILYLDIYLLEYILTFVTKKENNTFSSLLFLVKR